MLYTGDDLLPWASPNLRAYTLGLCPWGYNPQIREDLGTRPSIILKAKFEASISSGDCISPCEGKWLESCLTFLYNKLVLQINHGLPPVILISWRTYIPATRYGYVDSRPKEDTDVQGQSQSPTTNLKEMWK